MQIQTATMILGNGMMGFKKGQGLKELTEQHQTRTGTPPEGNQEKKIHTHTHSIAYVTHKKGKYTKYT